MTVTVTSFRATFPEFSDIVKYPDSGVTFWLTFAGKLLDPCRWYDVLDEATMFFIAHQLALASKNVNGNVGGVVAPLSAKAVDKVSASYDTSAVKLENAGHWGGTSYGLQFLQLVRMFGAGPMQL